MKIPLVSSLQVKSMFRMLSRQELNQLFKETEIVAPEEEIFKQQKYKNTIKYCISTNSSEQFVGRELCSLVCVILEKVMKAGHLALHFLDLG